jgi:hypothetical protein
MLGFALFSPTSEIAGSILLFRNGIVAARVEGMTATNPHGSQIATANRAKPIDSFDRVLRTSGCKSTTRGK